ncbi:MAG: AAA family ATPase [Gemmatimonadales bacterium]|jgi:DNA-binding SARP family transcriptional activator
MPEALPSLDLKCFGPPTARLAGGDPPPDVLWRKHLALLIYLALSPQHTRTRDHLLGLLWPEKTQDKARHSLNEAVRRLRAGLGSERLVSEGETLRLSGDALEVDALRSTELPEGDFLEGFGLGDAPAFEDWAAAQRSKFRAAGVESLLKQGEAALGENRFRRAREAGRQALALDSSSEIAASLLMRAAALAGDATAALAVYHQFRERLRADMGEDPGQELQALAERIRTRKWRRASAQMEDLDPPLVGRSDAHATAFALLEEALKSGGRCLVISGDPGMGKTRLINECAERLALAGAVVVRARPLESDHDAKWSTLRLLARSGLAAMPGAAGADPRALGVLAGLVPELAERFEPEAAQDAGDVSAALASLLGAVAEEQPVGVLLDEAHLADGSTVAALEAAARSLGAAPVILVLAVDPSASTMPRELLRLMGEVGRGVRGASVRLEPFGIDDMRDLVAALAAWCEGPEQVERLARRLTFEAGGNPLYAVTLLRGLDRTTTLKEDLVSWPPKAATLEGALPFTMPQLANMAVVARVAELDAESQAVLKAASITGVALDLPLIATLAESPLERVEEVLDILEQRRLVVYDGNRYTFSAALIPQVIRGECITSGQRRRLRKRAIEELEARDDLESRVLLAELRAKVEPDDAAFGDAVEIARTAHEDGSLRTAQRALAAAARMAAKGDPARQEVVEELRTSLGGKSTQTGPGI